MDVILYAEVNVICIIVLTIIATKAMTFGYDQSLKNKLFTFSLWFAVAANLFDFLWDTGTGMIFSFSLPMLWGLNMLYFLCFEGAAFCWFLYAKTRRNKNFLNSKKRVIFSALPAAVLALLILLSCFNGCVFYIDNAGEYHRGAFFWLQPLLSYGYVFYIFLESIILALKKKNYVRRTELISVASFSLPILLAVGIQIHVQSIPIVSAGITISFLLVYINNLQFMISVDPVTGISDRRQLLLSLATQADNLKPHEKLYFLFLDIDSFKEINDTYGHDEGDRVLRVVASALRAMCMEHNAQCARYGGDEFAVVQVLGEDQSIETLCCEFQERLKQKIKEQIFAFEVDISIGYAEYHHDAEMLQDLIIRADKSMYREKKSKVRQ